MSSGEAAGVSALAKSSYEPTKTVRGAGPAPAVESSFGVRMSGFATAPFARGARSRIEIHVSDAGTCRLAQAASPVTQFWARTSTRRSAASPCYRRVRGALINDNYLAGRARARSAGRWTACVGVRLPVPPGGRVGQAGGHVKAAAPGSCSAAHPSGSTVRVSGSSAVGCRQRHPRGPSAVDQDHGPPHRPGRQPPPPHSRTP